MIERDITRYQNWGRQGYVDVLRCLDRYHPPLVADPDAERLTAMCVFCNYRREIGLQEQIDLMQKIKYAEATYALTKAKEIE